MGKKSKNKKGRNKNSRAASTRSTNSSLAVELPADAFGRMPEKDGRRLYSLLECLRAIAQPRLELDRAKTMSTPPPSLPWKPGPFGNQDPELRGVLVDYILQNINQLSEEIDSGRHDSLCHRILGRRLTKGDKDQIRSWKLHVKDDFFVIDHIPGIGTVLCQCGRMTRKDADGAPIGVERDIHEPRLFVVKGLASPLVELTGKMADAFEQAHPGAVHEHKSKYKIALVHMTVVPYAKSLTYMATVGQASCMHYQTPQDMKEAVDLAVKTFETSSLSSETAAVDNVPLYRSFNPETDSSIGRLSSEPGNKIIYESNLTNVKTKYKRTAEGSDSARGDTTLSIIQMLWKPYEDTSHPNFGEAIARAGSGPKPFLMEGIKSQMREEVDRSDTDPCPFHHEYGAKGASFKDCCKKMHLKRVARSARTAAPCAIYMYNPLKERESELLQEAIVDGTAKNPMNHVRIGPMDVQVGRIRVPTWAVDIVKDRLDECPLFHAVLEYKWVYTGHMALIWPSFGLMVFGDIVLDETTGVIEFEAMTAERISHLIRELRYICTGIDILEASLEAQPANKLKPDTEMLEKNRALLKEGLDIEVSVSLDKNANESIGRKCAYCGMDDQEKLCRCSRCKSVHYCCRDHQVLHKEDHREECIKIAALREGKHKSK